MTEESQRAARRDCCPDGILRCAQDDERKDAQDDASSFPVIPDLIGNPIGPAQA